MSKPGLGRIILTYVLVGPPFGFVGLFGFMALAEFAQGRVPPPPPNFLNGLPFILVFSYVLGALPAIISSLFMAKLIKRGWSFWPLLGSAIVVGAVASLIGLFWVVFGPNGDQSKWIVVGSLATAGALAAVVSTLVLVWMVRRKPAG